MQNLSPRRAFTLIELMLAIAIAVAVMVVALPNLRGTAARQRLQDTFDKFDKFTRKAQFNAVRDQRQWSLSWQADRILLQCDEVSPEEQAGGGVEQEEFPILDGESYGLERHAALLAPKDTEAVWSFWRSGTCEPVIVNYSGPDGTWSAQYNPLTGHGEITDQTVK
jgi:prepilin-type N-terminal cleavage/methylation domain-containing protein